MKYQDSNVLSWNQGDRTVLEIDRVALPLNYIDQVKTAAQKQAVLAGYRLANLLEQVY